MCLSLWFEVNLVNHLPMWSILFGCLPMWVVSSCTLVPSWIQWKLCLVPVALSTKLRVIRPQVSRSERNLISINMKLASVGRKMKDDRGVYFESSAISCGVISYYTLWDVSWSFFWQCSILECTHALGKWITSRLFDIKSILQIFYNQSRLYLGYQANPYPLYTCTLGVYRQQTLNK